MTNALESTGKAATIARNPCRRQQAPRPLLVIDPAHLDAGVAEILMTIKQHRRRYGCGSYLFIEPSMTVYVITEEQSIVQEWIRSRFSWLVGRYCPVAHQKGLRAPLGVNDGMTATFDGVREDVADHLHLEAA